LVVQAAIRSSRKVWPRFSVTVVVSPSASLFVALRFALMRSGTPSPLKSAVNVVLSAVAWMIAATRWKPYQPLLSPKGKT
jgi:hypothetical protein